MSLTEVQVNTATTVTVCPPLSDAVIHVLFECVDSVQHTLYLSDTYFARGLLAKL